MTHLNPQVIEHLNEQELRTLYAEILNALVRSGQAIEECPLTALTLSNIRRAIQRKQARGPRM